MENLIYEHNFKDGLEDWIVEGAAEVKIACGNLHVNAADSVTPGSTIWCRHIFSGNIKITYSACILPPIKSSNINMFVFFDDSEAASEERIKTADYGLYHNQKTYITTYLNENDNIRVRLRKCPGFELLSETRLKDQIEVNKVQNMEFICLNGKITFKANGSTLIEYEDAEPIITGKIGLRTWNTRMWWNNIKVYCLEG